MHGTNYDEAAPTVAPTNNNNNSNGEPRAKSRVDDFFPTIYLTKYTFFLFCHY